MTRASDPIPFDAPSPATAPVEMPAIAAAGFAAGDAAASPVRVTDRVEWQTLGLAAVIYGGWTAALLAGGQGWVPLWAWAPLAAWCVAWHSSLQHEVIHGHPTPNAAVNRWIAGPPLALWLCYERYRATHLRHHRDDRLTDPLDDPESFYVTDEAWRRAGRFRRVLLCCLNTLAGRLVAGPPWAVGRAVLAEVRAVRRGRPGRAAGLARHVAAAVVVGAVVDQGFGVPIGLYVLAVVWPATALMLLRSFAEHRPAAETAHRSAIVESRGPLAWLFLSNNLHALHHERPGLPWYVLPKIYRANRDAVLARNGGYRLAGYAEVAWRWLLSPRDHPRHPGWTA